MPTTPGTYTFIASANDANRMSAAQAFSHLIASYYFGCPPNDTLSTNYALSSGRLYAFGPYSGLANNGNLQHLAAYLLSATSGIGPNQIQMALYADNGGVPDGGALLSTSAVTNLYPANFSNMGWAGFVAQVNAAVTTAGIYWIVLCANSANGTIGVGTSSVNPGGLGPKFQPRYAAGTFGTMPPVFPTSSALGGGTAYWGIYASYS